MGLHFHGHRVAHYKTQERNEERDRVAGAKVNTLEQLKADIKKHILDVTVDVPFKNAKETLDLEARQLINAIDAYKEVRAKEDAVIVAPVVKPKP